MAAMRYYGNILTTTIWRLHCTVAIADVFYIFNSTVVDWTCIFFKNHSFVSWKIIGIFFIYDVKPLTLQKTGKLPISPLSQSRYQLFSSNILPHIISVNMSALPHCQVGDKQEWSDNRDYVITEFPTRVNVYVLLGELWWNVVRNPRGVAVQFGKW